MGVRPPSDDVEDDPDVVEFGIAALGARLEDSDLAFPATKSELEERFGQTDVPFDAAGNSIGFSEALARIDRERFETEQDLLNALHPVFEKQRRSASNSLLSQLRALVPF